MNFTESLDCPCTNTHLVSFTRANGVLEVREQCIDCGKKVRVVSRVGLDLATLPKWDDSLKDRLKSIRAAHKVEQKELWLAEYQTYLASPQWIMVRQLVLERDDYKCQNCFKRVTDESANVHHLSYDGYKRLGRSFAFELVTLCRGCHSAWHSK